MEPWMYNYWDGNCEASLVSVWRCMLLRLIFTKMLCSTWRCYSASFSENNWRTLDTSFIVGEPHVKFLVLQVAAIFKIANSKDIPEIPDCFSKEGKDFLSLCLKRDPVQRPSAALLLGHPFVQDHQAVRAPTCNGTQLRNGISSPAASHRKVRFLLICFFQSQCRALLLFWSTNRT